MERCRLELSIVIHFTSTSFSPPASNEPFASTEGCRKIKSKAQESDKKLDKVEHFISLAALCYAYRAVNGREALWDEKAFDSIKILKE